MRTLPGGGAQAGLAHHRALWSWRRWAVGVAAVGLLALAVLAERPLLGESIHSFTRLQYLPLFWALVSEIRSMISLALLERRILILAGTGCQSAGRSPSPTPVTRCPSRCRSGVRCATAFTYRRMVSHGAEPPWPAGPSRWPASRRTSPSW